MLSTFKSGVYVCRNLVNGKVYVGSSVYVANRIKFHKTALRSGYCHNCHLQSAWNKYGESSFEFRLLENCPPELCIEREQVWIDKLQASNRLHGYNLAPRARNTLGLKMTETAKANMSKAMQKISGDISARMKGNKNGKNNTKPKSEEHKAKIRAASQKQWADPEARARMSAIKKARYATDEDLKKRLSEANRGKTQSAETVAKRVAKLRGQKRDWSKYHERKALGLQ